MTSDSNHQKIFMQLELGSLKTHSGTKTIRPFNGARSLQKHKLATSIKISSLNQEIKILSNSTSNQKQSLTEQIEIISKIINDTI